MGQGPLMVCTPKDDTKADKSHRFSSEPKERVCVIHSRPSTPDDGETVQPKQTPVGAGFLVGNRPSISKAYWSVDTTKDGR
mmetsp:Transcript_35191/g.65189  ORF Transcript_35191/g.65189 Transcript_35191/m.65189 type:complete len:81 (+) Transcript_35191:61-303(+)